MSNKAVRFISFFELLLIVVWREANIILRLERKMKSQTCILSNLKSSPSTAPPPSIISNLPPSEAESPVDKDCREQAYISSQLLEDLRNMSIDGCEETRRQACTKEEYISKLCKCQSRNEL
ncbi:uncharacterized protein LOC122294368 [Carya illinoinensis]|nr:uncharacterized protein LOC122294368 [Carya illinoinensis]